MGPAVCQFSRSEEVHRLRPLLQGLSAHVLDLVERSEQLLADADDDDADDDDEMMVMTIANGADCIGCGACGRVCPKDCYTYAPAEG
jgi:ferredoxin